MLGQLKGLDLNGTLPDEFGDLPYLQVLDLSRNYINGSIPAKFGRLSLTNLSLFGNRISGSIPNELSNISTLEELVLEANQLGEHLPPSLGKLSHLRRLVLSANNFTGTIPKNFHNLKNLIDLIDGNNLSGKIPDWIGNWTKLQKLLISDLSGPTTSFPNLKDMNKLKTLVMRNCSITGEIPEDIGNIESLKILDLTFNRLNGTIPVSFKQEDKEKTKLDFMFLSNNSLTGEVPIWIRSDTENKIDLSYNNFTGPHLDSCEYPVNLVSSYASSARNMTRWCLQKDLPCSGKAEHYSLYINCGGDKITSKGKKYEKDDKIEGASQFSIDTTNKWAYSSTGAFIGNQGGSHLAKNTSALNSEDEEIYQTARLAPISLKYYGLCLRKGSYKVQLCFAEIMFSNDQTFGSLGKRLFDVSIQGNVVLRDFNIMEKAEGAGKGICRDFDAYVDGSTLEIHLYWTGKGTNSIPEKGVYGPLISAIAVTPKFNPNPGLSVGGIIGIVIASCVVLILILVLLRMKGYLGGKDLEDRELRELGTGYFSLRQIKAATNNFDSANKIGEGGFGPVYKGVLSDGSVIAVKQLSSKSKQGNREFVNEIGMISALQHPNLVKLYGCCIEGNQLLLIYEYLENNSLARALFGRDEQRLNLDWPTRKKICLGIARGLAYLHEESRLKIVHRDIKATNVLLDKNLNAKISDFGLAKLDEDENTHISTRIAGTIGYMAPEYAMRGYLTDKADVYSFGIVALEIVSGKSNTNYRPKEEFVYLLDWAYVLHEQGNLLELVDPSLGSNYSEEEVMRMLNLALLCTNQSPTLRPPMSSVVSMLDGKIAVQAPTIKHDSMNPDMRFKAFEKLSLDSQSHVSAFSVDSQVQGSISLDGPWIDSSISLHSREETRDFSSSSKLLTGHQDLYSIHLD
ncbi:putative LRR receptor-like serine/threonine-protein kinase [Vitis vinifera]|uniref:non-specific serine/threonine protein kinase n=1 Tax=Vitis vinifera TaxID=29760 RepID=A0A438J4S6_VITVI|nr:putative LRR receptor-like serine/threonine-protein kinase [Vitis vinifera]